MIINSTAFALPLKAETVHCCITSPPYWGLRKYSGLSPMVFGGIPKCGHEFEIIEERVNRGNDAFGIAASGNFEPPMKKHGFCKCGAWLGDFGLEPTLELYIEHSMAVLDEIWRVLRKDGTLWWNLGDSYAHSQPGRNRNGTGGQIIRGEMYRQKNEESLLNGMPEGLKSKDLCLVPFRFALAAQKRGWWIRSAIIWSKPNPMPESVTDRPTDAYEHIFLMTRSGKYWYDAEAVREKLESLDSLRSERQMTTGQLARESGLGTTYPQGRTCGANPSGRNLRNVWTFATQPYAEAHFATFPEELPRRCILAGCPEKVCAKCGTGWVRILEKKERTERTERTEYQSIRQGKMPCPNDWIDPQNKTLGWKPSCSCGTQETAKGVVLDPFSGSGTVVDVAIRSGRQGIGVELSKEYLKLAQKRTENSRKQGVLL